MDRDQVLADVLAHVAEQRCEDARALLDGPDEADAFTLALRAFVASMSCDHAAATRWARAAEAQAAEAQAAEARTSDDTVDRLLSAAVLALAAAADADVDDSPVAAALPALVADVDLTQRVAAFGRYVAVEAALANARLGLATALQQPGPPTRDVWSGHSYVGVMRVCDARVLAFSGEIRQALVALEGSPGSGMVGQLVNATHALVAGNSADLVTMQALVAEVRSADVPAIDRLGRGVHLLLAFSEIALGDVNGAAGHLLRAGGGARLESLMIVDRALTHEIFVAQAVAEDDPESALAWQQLAEEWAEHRCAAPAVLRGRARIAILAGDAAAAESAAAEAVTLARLDDRLVELAEGEMVLAQARLAADNLPDATRSLRDAVVAGDSTGHLAVRHAATRLLRPARRRLPPISGGGRDSLSSRERDIADLVAVGESNAAIAARLHLSETTVRTHVTRVLTAYGVATRTGLLARLHDLPAEPRRPADLTPRQGDVAALVAAGRGNTEIASALGISLKSVESHLSAIRDRWQVTSRFDAAIRWWDLQQDVP